MTKNDIWISSAIHKIEADFNRSADTHLIKVELPRSPNVHLYLKDESTHPTRSLKHRLARSLFLYGLCNGWINQNTPIIEASSGSTAVSEAYFARLIGLPFIAVMPKTTSKQKIAKIEHYGGKCHLIDTPSAVYQEAEKLAHEMNGHYMDQFTFAERATDWRGNNNIAESIYQQMQEEPFPTPNWIVVGAGTGGTSATIGRYIRYFTRQNPRPKLCVVDPENSVFYDYFNSRNQSLTTECCSSIEGIGRPRVEPSFIADIVDKMIKVPDVASFAAIHFLEKILGRKCGGSTGTNLYGVLQIIDEMIRNNESGSVVTLICDPGDLYLDTYYNSNWLAENNYNVQPYLEKINKLYYG